MDHKVLIRLNVPEIEESYEMYIPINKTIGELIESLTKLVNDLSKVYPIKKTALVCNKKTGKIYDKNILVIDSDIRNGTQLILF